ncbi:hypothetical protein D5R81_19705 [Parashewanella spongiae]|uniref:Uncharacterized protein n=1 Tax=Parashewanella spongiae TaxID=342950 RepID=A0A3A6TKW4_9GAMM|nr:hypothetical protein [Parashewanella spongiae]MCL1079680.1 hypothetical protein [Parashewanella spongiae]RJY01893.1 hypothetical protein D5R81_19705 [Parashewanella spongiae]
MSKKNKILPRKEWLEFVTETDCNGELNINYSIDGSGDINSINNLKDSFLTHFRSYQGENKEKKLSVISSGEKPSLSQERFSFENFDKIYFIDTNDSTFRGQKSCSTAVYELLYFKDALATLGGKLCFKFLVGFYQFDVLEVAKGERIGWHLFIENSRILLDAIESKKDILLVTDHELGLHEKINNREIPYYLDFFLPKNVTLGYAKADKAGSVLESGMKVADKMSNKIKEDFHKYSSKRLKIQTLKYDNNFKGYIEVPN